MNKKISIFEVGSRDGLQNIKNEIPINRKIELIDILSTTGIKKIECGSFVSAKWVPQMKGTDRIFQEISRRDGITLELFVILKAFSILSMNELKNKVMMMKQRKGWRNGTGENF